MCTTNRKPSEGVGPLTATDTFAAKSEETVTVWRSAAMVLPPPFPKKAPLAVNAASTARPESSTKLEPLMAEPA